MKHLRRITAIVILAIFGGLLWLAYYAHSDGFTNKWKKLIRDQFAKHHILVEIPKKLTIDPFQGLVANDVQLLQDGTGAMIASISKVRLDLDLAKLLRDPQSSLEMIELASTDLSLPYDRSDPNSNRVELKDVSATIIFKRGRLELVEVLANFYGVRVRLTGTLLTADEETQGSLLTIDQEKIKGAEPIISQVIQHCERLQYLNKPAPLLDLVVSGDLTKPETLRVEASVSGEDFRYGSYAVKSLEGEATIDATAVDVASLSVRDHAEGWLLASSKIPLTKEPATFKLESSLAIDQFLAELMPKHLLWEWLDLSSAPFLDLTGTVLLGEDETEASDPPFDIMGTVKTGAFQLKGESFEALSGGFHVKGKQFFFRDVVLTHARGKSKGKVIYQPEEGLKYDLEIGMDPKWLQALPLSPEVAAFLDRWRFQEGSSVAFDIKGSRTRNNTASWEHQGTLYVTNCGFDTVDLSHLTMDFKVDPYTYYFSNLEALLEPDLLRGYPGGRIDAERVNLSTRSQVVVLNNVTSRVHPAQVIRCFDHATAAHFDEFTFDDAPEVKIVQGTLDLAGKGQTNLRAEIKVPSIMTAPVMGKSLPFTKPRFQLFFYGESLLARVFHAGLLEGRLEGQIEIKDLFNKQPYSANLDVSEVDFGKLATYYFPDYEAGGQLTGNINWSGEGSKMLALKGGGVGNLVNCPAWQVPVLGPLSRLLDSVIGENQVTHGTVRDLGAKFLLAKGKLVFQEILADMEAYRIDGNGQIDLATEALDFEVALSNQTAAGALLNVLYQAFGTYQCSGTLDDPKWRLVSRLDPAKAEALLKRGANVVPLDPKALLNLDPTGLLKNLLDKAQGKQKKDSVEDGER